MIDNAPFYTKETDIIKAFINSGKLNFVQDVVRYDRIDGVELKTSYYKYFNLNISIKYDKDGRPQELKSKGSLHYLYNDGLHNANDFNFNNLRDTINQIKNDFNVSPFDLILSPIEYAVMVVTNYSVPDIIENTFMEQRKAFNKTAKGEFSIISGNTNNEKRLKFYYKYDEFPLECRVGTLRLEVQQKRMRGINKEGIKTLGDLLKRKNLLILSERHFNYYRHLVLCDYTIKLPRTSKYKNQLTDFKNLNYWRSLVRKSRAGNDYETKYNDDLKTLNKLSKIYGNNLLNELLQLSKNKWIDLLGVCKNQSAFLINRPKDAQLYKPKEAPFIECTPFQFKVNRENIKRKQNQLYLT